MGCSLLTLSLEPQLLGRQFASFLGSQIRTQKPRDLLGCGWSLSWLRGRAEIRAETFRPRISWHLVPAIVLWLLFLLRSKTFLDLDTVTLFVSLRTCSRTSCALVSTEVPWLSTEDRLRCLRGWEADRPCPRLNGEMRQIRGLMPNLTEDPGHLRWLWPSAVSPGISVSWLLRRGQKSGFWCGILRY